jgi:hypothetical protein
VKAPESLKVLLLGTLIGNTNEPIAVMCGTAFISLARELPQGGLRIVSSIGQSSGKTAVAACQAITTLEFGANEIRPEIGGGPLPGGVAPGRTPGAGTPGALAPGGRAPAPGAKPTSAPSPKPYDPTGL